MLESCEVRNCYNCTHASYYPVARQIKCHRFNKKMKLETAMKFYCMEWR